MTTIKPSTAQNSVVVSSPMRPIFKPRSALKRTREEGDDDEDGAEEGLATKKRKTVLFNESLNVVRNIGNKTLIAAKREVKQALERHVLGDDEDYDSLKEQLTIDVNEYEERGERKDLLPYIVALTAYVPLIGQRGCASLLAVMLKVPWLDLSDDIARAYIQFVAGLSSLRGSFLGKAFSMVIDKFSEVSPSRGISGYETVPEKVRRERLHLALRYLLSLFPETGRRIILNLVSAKFPFSEDAKQTHMAYLANLLMLRKEVPDLEGDLMEIMISNLVKLDVEMSLDLDDGDDETTQAVLRLLELSEAKGESDDDSDADSDASEDEDDEETRRVSIIKNKVETLDAILDLLFSIYEPIFKEPDSMEALRCFHDLLSAFCNVVIPSLKSRHVQYLLFHLAQKSPALAETFIGTLLNMAFDASRPAVVRQTAVAFMASFTARAKKISDEQIQQVAQCFLDYMDYYRGVHIKNCVGPDVRKYAQFYSLTQGLLYVFCFRWRSLLRQHQLPASVDPEDASSYFGHELPWLPGLKSRLQANIISKLNPLKVCNSFVVEEFARISHATQFLYVADKIALNRQVRLFQNVTGSYTTGGALRETIWDPQDPTYTELDVFSAFDPYQLPLSRRWLALDETYISWRSIAMLDRAEPDYEEDWEGDEKARIEEATVTDDEEDDD